MKEREFQAQVIKLAKKHGWSVWHVPTPMRPIPGRGKFVPDKRGAGLPDLILIHPDPPRMILAEIKVDQELSERQKEFLRLARAVARETSPEPLLDRWADLYGDGRPGDVAASEMHAAIVDRETTIGVYVWRPGNEALIEATLRSKVMIPS